MTLSLEPADHTAAGLDQAFQQLACAGGWFSGAQRIAIARETRSARECALCAERKAALSPYSSSDSSVTKSSEKCTHTLRPVGSESGVALSAAAIDAIHRITTDPGRLSKQWYDETQAAGLAPEELVEMTSVIAVTTIADTLARALSQPQRTLPAPVAGKPRRRSVRGATVERGWVPMVDPESAEGLTKAMYETVESAAGFVFNVARALTSVPEALRDFFSAFFPNYSTHGPVRPGGLDRGQVELLASSTSAYNDCFY